MEGSPLPPAIKLPVLPVVGVTSHSQWLLNQDLNLFTTTNFNAEVIGESGVATNVEMFF